MRQTTVQPSHTERVDYPAQSGNGMPFSGMPTELEQELSTTQKHKMCFCVVYTVTNTCNYKSSAMHHYLHDM